MRMMMTKTNGKAARMAPVCRPLRPPPEEDRGRQRLNNAPGEFDPVGRVKAAVGGERPKYESGGIC